MKPLLDGIAIASLIGLLAWLFVGIHQSLPQHDSPETECKNIGGVWKFSHYEHSVITYGKTIAISNTPAYECIPPKQKRAVK